MSGRRLNLADFRDDDEEEEEEDALSQFLPKKQLSLNELKTKTFSHGITKKSKKDLEREAEEKKRKEEEEALAKVNAELEDSFNAPGGMYGFGPGAAGRGRGMGGGFVRAGGAGYEPPNMPASLGATIPTGPSKMPPQGPAAMGYVRASRPKSPSPPRTAGRKGKRAMDSFLEEIKNNQQARESRFGNLAKQEGSSVTALAAWEHNPAARNAAAVQPVESTNVMVSNLPANVTEESLGRFFAKCGPVGTIKIMWPRGVAEIQAMRSGRASVMGFVNFMTREGAARAINELDKVTWGGAFLRLSWGQPMPLPLKPLYGDHKRESSDRQRRSRSRSSSASSASPPPRRDLVKPVGPSSRHRDSGSRSKSPSRSRSPRRDVHKQEWLGKISGDSDTFVRAVAKRVVDNGKSFEELLRKKEKDNTKFAFLFNDDLPEYHLYKHSLDKRYRFPTPPRETFNDEGYASCYSSDSAEDSERERTTKGKIGRLARKRFESMLRALSGKRIEIARAMEFAMTHAEAADEVADVVCKSLMVEATAVPRKIARLHLISDILHNSASPLPNVWRYRLAFENRLIEVFAHLAGVYQSLLAYSGKISADVFRGQVGAVLEIWEGWIALTPEASVNLRALLDGETTLAEIEAAKAARNAPQQTEEEKREAKEQERRRAEEAEAELGRGKGFRASGFKSSFKRAEDTSAEAEALLREVVGMGGGDGGGGEDDVDVDGEPMEEDQEEDMDGEPMGDDDVDDVDGEPIDVDGEPMEDVDGEEMDLDDDLDGEAM